MSSTFAHPHLHHAQNAAKRFGYVLAVAVNGILLWATHQLLDWEWPGFLTQEFEELLPVVTVSFLVSMALNAAYVVHDGDRFRGFGDVVTSLVGLVVVVQTWVVFPFDFSEWATDWSWLVRTMLVIGAFGIVAGAITGLAKLVGGTSPQGDN